MMKEDFFMMMNVLYKLPNQPKPVRGDWVVGSLKEMMKILEKEGITRDSVEYLYVHYSPRGSTDVMELVAVDNNHGKSSVAKDNVIPFRKKDEAKPAEEKTVKPRVRLKATNEQVAPTLRSYLFVARQV